MASLTGTKIKDTYDGLLKTTDNGALGASAKLITDGLGNSSGVYLGTSGNVGIGVNPSYKLDVSSVSRFTDGFYLAQATAGTNASIYLGSDQTLELEAFGASGEIAFSTGSSVAERMRIDSSGHIDINGGNIILRNSSLYAPASGYLKDGFIANDDGNLEFAINGASNGAYGTMSFITRKGDSSDPIEAMNIDHSGNVGIGDSPSFAFDVNITSSRTRFKANSGDCNIELSAIAGRDWLISSLTDGSLRFYDEDASSERMRITSGGDVQIFGNPTSSPYEGAIIEDVANGCRFNIGRSANAILLGFYNQNGIVGNIQTNGSSTSYNTSSDYRLKEDWQPMADALTRVDALNPVNFAWKADGSRVDGFLAHELQEVIPEAVTGTKDAMRDEEYEVSPAVYEDVVHPAEEAVYETIEHPAIAEELDADGNIIVEAQEAWTEEVLVSEAKEEWTEQVLVSEAVMGTRSVPDYQGIDQSKIVPLLVAAIQELKAEVDALKGA